MGVDYTWSYISSKGWLWTFTIWLSQEDAEEAHNFSTNEGIQSREEGNASAGLGEMSIPSSGSNKKVQVLYKHTRFRVGLYDS